MVDVGARSVYVGNDAMRMRGVLKVKYPIQRGVIMDWNEYYEILNHIFYTLLRIENLSNYNIYVKFFDVESIQRVGWLFVLP